MSEPPPVNATDAFAIDPPRCPKCYYRLEGLALVGDCPECGAAYDGDSRFRYARPGGFWKGVWRWTWPICVGLPVVGLAFVLMSWIPGADVTLAVVGICVPILAFFVNAVVQSYRTLRRRRLRRAAVTAFVPTAGLYAQSLGCGVLVFAVAFFLVFGVSCGLILLSLNSGPMH